MSHVRCAVAVTAAMNLIWTLAPRSGRADEPPSITLEALLNEVRSRSPSVRGAREQAEAAKLRPRALGLPEDPSVSVEWWQQPVDFSSVPLMVTVRQDLPYPRTLRLEREVGEHAARGVAEQAEATLATALAEARVAYFELLRAERSLALNDQVQAILERVVRVADANYRAGKAEQADVFRAQAELLETESERYDYEQVRTDAVARLAALLDRPPETPIVVSASGADAIGSLPPVEELVREALARRPELRGAAASLDEARTQVELARRGRLPRLSGWAGYMVNVHGTDAFTVGVGTTLPIFAGQRSRAEEQAARAELRSMEAARDELRRRTEAAVRSAVAGLQAASAHVRLHADKLVPLADLTLRSAETAYASGRGSFQAVLDAARMVRAHHLDHLRYLVEYQRQLTELYRLTGHDLDATMNEKTRLSYADMKNVEGEK